MDSSDPSQHRQRLAMSRDDNPWSGGEPEPGSAKPDQDAPGKDPDQPFNPWLAPEEGPKPRRSASIEDIFKSGPGGPPQVKPRWLVLALAGLLAAWLFATSLHVLARDERALVLTMGRYSKTIGPGVNLTLPWPFQSLVRRQVGAENVTIVPEKAAETLMPTRDGQLVDVAFTVRWRISDLKSFAFNLPQGEDAIRRLADAEVRAAVAELPFEAIWSGSGKAELEQRALRRTQKVLDAWHAGVTVTAIELTGHGPPARLAETFQKIADAKEKARLQHENDVAWRAREIENARKEAAEFNQIYLQYQIAPEVTRQKMYYETMERVLRNNRVIYGGSGIPGQVPLPPGPDPQPSGAKP